VEQPAADSRKPAESYRLLATWYKPHWVLASVLRASGRLDEAKAEAELADNLAGGKYADVTKTRVEIARLMQSK